MHLYLTLGDLINRTGHIKLYVRRCQAHEQHYRGKQEQLILK